MVLLGLDHFMQILNVFLDFDDHGRRATIYLIIELTSSHCIDLQLFEQTVLTIEEFKVNFSHEFLQDVDFFLVFVELDLVGKLEVLEHVPRRQLPYFIVLNFHQFFRSSESLVRYFSLLHDLLLETIKRRFNL